MLVSIRAGAVPVDSPGIQAGCAELPQPAAPCTIRVCNTFASSQTTAGAQPASRHLPEEVTAVQ
jgi:hypothetical protein